MDSSPPLLTISITDPLPFKSLSAQLSFPHISYLTLALPLNFSTMILSDKLALMAKKWRSVINRRRRRRRRTVLSAENDDTTKLALKGHFAVYTADERRFLVPLVYLKNEIFRKLLDLSEEEFGLSTNRPITLPCDAFWLEYLMTLTGEDHTEIRQNLYLSFLKQFRLASLFGPAE